MKIMSKRQIISYIYCLDGQHCQDKDGGYGLVKDLIIYANSLSAPEKALLYDILIELIEDQDEHLWGVALETIARLQTRGDVLLNLLDEYYPDKKDEEWYNQVILVLLRLRVKRVTPICLLHIKKGLALENNHVIPILAALCKVDRDAYLQLASEFFAERLKSATMLPLVESFIPAFVRNMADEENKLFRALIKNVSHIDRLAGARLKSLIENYLAKQWVKKSLGETRIRDILIELSG